VGYAECTVEITGSDNWINPRYFEKRGMRPMFVDELAVHTKVQGRGVGGFMLEQLQHLARSRGCTHLVLEVAENNRDALAFYKRRNFQRLDAAIFMAQKVSVEPELLPPRTLISKSAPGSSTLALSAGAAGDKLKAGSDRPRSRARTSKASKPAAKRKVARKAKPTTPTEDVDD